MVDWLELFRKVSEEICMEVKPLFGSDKAREAMGRGAGGDVTKYVDLLAEEIVVKALEAKDVSCMLISEECGVRRIGRGDGGFVVLDSVDGTTNATRSIPFVTTSIAHATSGYLTDVDVALVKDLYHSTDYEAVKGGGVFADGKPLSPSAVKSLEGAIVAVDLSSKERLPELLDRVTPILYRASKIRHLGSTALEVCYVASGALDAFVDLRGITRATDLAAAYLILKESGGVTATLSGEELDMPLRPDARASFISAANKALCSEILRCLNPRGG